jgi:hypothetical protein
VLTPVAALLAFAGTGLTAIAVFAPGRSREATVSFAPPVETAASAALSVERWAPVPETVQAVPHDANDTELRPGWPALLDARADGSETAVRLALVEALCDLATPWADAILQRARDEEPDPQVRAAAGAANRDGV